MMDNKYFCSSCANVFLENSDTLVSETYVLPLPEIIVKVYETPFFWCESCDKLLWKLKWKDFPYTNFPAMNNTTDDMFQQ